MAHWLPVYFIASDSPLQEPFGASFTFECTETRPSTASCARSPMCIKMSNTVCFFLFLLFQVTRGGLSFSPGHTHTHKHTLPRVEVDINCKRSILHHHHHHPHISWVRPVVISFHPTCDRMIDDDDRVHEITSLSLFSTYILSVHALSGFCFLVVNMLRSHPQQQHLYNKLKHPDVFEMKYL